LRAILYGKNLIASGPPLCFIHVFCILDLGLIRFCENSSEKHLMMF
jgi:hypothetical protein